MKKFLSVLMAATMLVGVMALTGCGEDKTATDDNDLISKHGFFREVSTNQNIAVVDTRHRQNKRFGT